MIIKTKVRYSAETTRTLELELQFLMKETENKRNMTLLQTDIETRPCRANNTGSLELATILPTNINRVPSYTAETWGSFM